MELCDCATPFHERGHALAHYSHCGIARPGAAIVATRSQAPRFTSPIEMKRARALRAPQVDVGVSRKATGRGHGALGSHTFHHPSCRSLARQRLASLGDLT